MHVVMLGKLIRPNMCSVHFLDVSQFLRLVCNVMYIFIVRLLKREHCIFLMCNTLLETTL